MISSKTVNVDNPRLNCRLKGYGNFSPIRINNSNSEDISSDDIFNINEAYIGLNPKSVQTLSLKIIVEFLNKINKKEKIQILHNQRANNVEFHILDRKSIKQIMDN